MNRLIAIASGLAAASSMFVTPSMAANDTGSYTQHQTDCLGLLFSDPKAHAEQCGGPFTVPQTWTPTSGYGSGGGCATVSEIAPIVIDGVTATVRSDEYRVAITTCCHPVAWKRWTDPSGNPIPLLVAGDPCEY